MIIILTLYQTTILWTGPNSKQLQTTNLMLLKLWFLSFDQVKNIVGKGENTGSITMFSKAFFCRKSELCGKDLMGIQNKRYVFRILENTSPARVAHCGEHVGLMTLWLRVWSPVELNFLSGVFLSLTSEEVCEKSSLWLWIEKLH